MTTRRWMIEVAVVGLLCFLEHRRRSFTSRAAYLESKMVAAMFPASPIKGLPMGRGIRRPNLTAERLILSLGQVTGFRYFDRAGKALTEEEVKVAIWREAMACKCRQAARYPWFPVMSDPPVPGSTAPLWSPPQGGTKLMRRPWMTTRRWLATVAGVALALGAHRAEQTRDAYLARAWYHARQEALLRGAPARAPTVAIGQTWEVINEPLIDYHAMLARKYRDAASRPWISVEPDPPKPK
jgi:hypothetical protein